MRAPRPSWTQTPPSKELGEPPARLLEWLALRFPRIDQETWRSRMERGLVTDAVGNVLGPEARYRPRLRVAYYREVRQEPEDLREIPVLYRDDDLVVVDKPPFVPVTPAGPWVQRCILYRLSRSLEIPDLTPIHRLDRATSGIVLFVRSREEAAPWSERFRTGAVERYYEAEAAAAEPPTIKTWSVENRLDKGEPFFTMKVVPGLPNARTEIQALAWRPHPVYGGVIRFALRPATGRQHQLRLHLASLGYPILGDRLYPTLTPERPDDPSDPLRLVARRLRIEDPRSGRTLEFTSGYELPSGPRAGT